MSIKCYIPETGIDDVIASKVPGWNKYRVATLRGMYDESHTEPLDISNIESATEALSSYRRNLGEENARTINSNSTNFSEAFKKLNKAFTAETLFNRVNMISTMFSDRIDAIQQANPTLSRQVICNGFMLKGKRVAGQTSIFESIYDSILGEAAQAKEEGYDGEVEAYQAIIDNWNTLIPYVRLRLRDTEGLKLGNKLDYADYNEDGFEENRLEELYDATESKRESWQETSDKKSAFGSLSKAVRKTLSTIQAVENGEEVYDDLGYPVMVNPVKAHQELMETLRGVTSESQMMGILTLKSKQHKWLESVVEELENDNVLKTRFFVDFKKNFQPYSILLEEVKQGVKAFKTKLLNKINDSLSKQYNTRISLGLPLNPKNSLFDSKGNINWETFKSFYDLIVTNLSTNKDVSTNSNVFNATKSKFLGLKVAEKKIFLRNVFEMLNIDIDNSVIDKIVFNSRDLRSIIKNLEELITFGADKILTKPQLEALKSGNLKDLPTSNFKKFIDTPGSANSKEGIIREKINKILNVVHKHKEGVKLESRVLHKDKNGKNITLFSNVTPSYMGDIFDKISSFVEHQDTAGLRKWIENEFLNSSFFKDGDIILNAWIEELYKSDLSKEGSFAENFTYKRFLGSQDNDFENFTSKQHIIDMFAEYRSLREISAKSEYAYYPVFILGDSGVCKYIQAKRYNKETILRDLYNVYKQEKRRMALAEASIKKLNPKAVEITTDENGNQVEVINWDKVTVKIDNFSSNYDRFSTLPFLNSDYIAEDGSVGKYYEMIKDNPTQQNVEKAIEAYMNDAVATFKSRIEKLGVLETKTVTLPDGKQIDSYFNLGKNITNADEVIEDYFWNTKFATIQQLQFFTIDPSYYNGTKDLQKRYKEIHAPGSILSVEAKDKNGINYSSDGIETCIYFDDISLNAEDYNPEFMGAIAYHFGKDSSIYKVYKKNTLTDGQGYRTLEGYRKVMGMAGQWTEEMQEVYDYILQLRNTYNGKQLPAEEVTKLTKMAVVFQPIKPYLYTIENLDINNDDSLKIPVQHKYAEIVLIPELLREGSKLRDMATWMDSKGIDMVGSTKIVKVGGFGAANIKGVTDKKSLEDALNSAYVHKLKYSDYRIQTNVPEHIQSSQLFGTQVRKLIMAGVIKHDVQGREINDYHYESYVEGNRVNLGGNYGKVRLNGRNLVSFYNALISANIVESFKTFRGEVSDPKKLSDKLVQATINNSREPMDNILAYSMTEEGDFLMPLFEGALEHDSSAMLFSMFKKRVNKQSIHGGSGVQASAMGISGYSESGDLKYVTDPNNPNNVIYAECELAFDFSYTDINGNTVDLSYEDYCNADGTLKLDESQELDITDPKNRIYASYYKVDSEGNKRYYMPLIERHYPEILNLLAYRIPTERDYSMINLRVVKFTPKAMGGVIKVPAQGTTISGFDYDIDKLYFMRREYTQRALSSSEVAEIWKEFYETYPNIKDVLKEAREEDTESFDRLYKYWESTNLPYSYKEAFSQFLEDKGYTSFETYDYEKSPLENTRSARNNMLIKLIQERLMDEETFTQRYTPGGFANASRAARVLRELLFGKLSGIVERGVVHFDKINERIDNNERDPEPNYDPSDPMTIVTYNQQNQVAGKLIGIFANQNTNHAFASLMKTFAIKPQKVFSFAGHKYTDLLHAPEGIDVDLNVAEFLSASVDAVKDPVLNFLNLNTITADSGALLARLGYTTQEIGLLFNQPIIREVCEYSFNVGVNVSEAIRAISEQYKEDIPADLVVDAETDFSTNRMALNIVNYRSMQEKGANAMDNLSFRENQVKFLQLFSSILDVTSDISSFISSSKFTAANAAGSTWGDYYAQQSKVRNYLSRFKKNAQGKNSLSVVMQVTETIESPIYFNDRDLVDNNYMESIIENPLAYEQVMFDANVKTTQELSKYYPYETFFYKSVRELMTSLTKSTYLDADTINSIHRDLLTFILSQQEFSVFNGETPITVGGTTVSAREYYTKNFAKRCFESVEVDPYLKNLPLFQYMQFIVDDETGDVGMSLQSVGGLAPHIKDAIMQSWAELANSEDYKALARDLFVYNFYKTGFSFAPSSFMSLAPTEVKLSLKVGKKWVGREGGEGHWEHKSYTDFLKEVFSGVNFDPNFFAQQYIRNHPDSYKFVYSPKESAKKIVKSLVYKSGIAQNSFTLDISKLGTDALPFVLDSSSLPEGHFAFIPCIKIDGMLYMCNGNGSAFNVSESDSIEYIKVDPLGKTNVVTQYFSTPDKVKPITLDNTEVKAPVIDEQPISEQTVLSKDTRESVITEIVSLGIKLGQFGSEDFEVISRVLSGHSDQDLLDTVKDARNQARDKGLIDNTGEKVC